MLIDKVHTPKDPNLQHHCENPDIHIPTNLQLLKMVGKRAVFQSVLQYYNIDF